MSGSRKFYKALGDASLQLRYVRLMALEIRALISFIKSVARLTRNIFSACHRRAFQATVSVDACQKMYWLSDCEWMPHRFPYSDARCSKLLLHAEVTRDSYVKSYIILIMKSLKIDISFVIRKYYHAVSCQIS